MQQKISVLAGFSEGEGSFLLSFLTDTDQLHFAIELADTKELFLQKAALRHYQVYIVSYQFLNNRFAGFSDFAVTNNTGTATILLCNRAELELAVDLLCNHFTACLVAELLTAEKVITCIEACIHTLQQKPAPGPTHFSAAQQQEAAQEGQPDLQKFYERFNRISSTTNDAVWEWNLAENSFWANENHQQLFGLKRTDPVPSKEIWASHIHPDDRQRILELQEQALQSGANVFISEYRFRCNEGYKHMLDRCYIERNSKGTPVLMMGSMMDITERKTAEAKINDSNERFELIAKATNEALWELDLHTGYTWSNEVHQQLYGLTVQDKPPTLEEWEAQIHSDERAAVLKSFHDVLNSAENIWTCEYRMFNYKGEEITIFDRTYIVRNNEGKPVRMLGSMTDITERKKASEALMNSEEKYRTLVEQATDAIFIADANGRFAIVNPAALKLSQYSEEELMQMTIYDLADREELNVKPFAFAAMRSEKGASSERRLRRKDGAVIDVEINARFLSDGRFLAFVRDVTERKKAEEELNNSYKAIRKLTSHLQHVREEERKHIARNIHDELGQLLTVLKMDVSWLSRKIKDLHVPAITHKADQIAELLNTTVQSVRRIAADLRPGLLDDLGLSAAIEWHLSDFGKRTGIQTNFILANQHLNLPAEKATSLFRIYQESITNIARHAAATEVTVELMMDTAAVVMRVADNGKGFDASMIGKSKTLGILGMKERAEMMDGSFRIIKNSTGGMQIEVRLPVSDTALYETVKH